MELTDDDILEILGLLKGIESDLKSKEPQYFAIFMDIDRIRDIIKGISNAK